MSERHVTQWEDEQIVGYYCIEDPAQPRPRHHTVSVDSGVTDCYYCHGPIRLVWNVYVEDLA